MIRLCAAEYVGHFAHVGVFLARKGKCRRCFSFNSCCTLDLRRSRLEAQTLGVQRKKAESSLKSHEDAASLAFRMRAFDRELAKEAPASGGVLDVPEFLCIQTCKPFSRKNLCAALLISFCKAIHLAHASVGELANVKSYGTARKRHLAERLGPRVPVNRPRCLKTLTRSQPQLFSPAQADDVLHVLQSRQ